MPEYFFNPETEEIVTKSKSSKKCIFLGEFENQDCLYLTVYNKNEWHEHCRLAKQGIDDSHLNYLVIFGKKLKERWEFDETQVILKTEKTEQFDCIQEKYQAIIYKQNQLKPLLDLADYFVAKCNEKNIKIESRAKSATDFGYSVYVYAMGNKYRFSDRSVGCPQRIMGEIHSLDTIEKIDNYFNN